MASIFVANVTGNGSTADSAFRPSGFNGERYAVLMLDETNGKCLVFSPNDAIVGTGIQRLVQAADRQALLAACRTTSPNAAQRTAIANWCTNAGYQVPNYAGNPTWFQVITFLARLVSPAADVDGCEAA